METCESPVDSFEVSDNMSESVICRNSESMSGKVPSLVPLAFDVGSSEFERSWWCVVEGSVECSCMCGMVVGYDVVVHEVCSVSESDATEGTGPLGHPSTAVDPTEHVCCEGTLAGLGCGLGVGLSAVHVTGTIDSDLSCPDSSPECPSNFECALSFDPDTDPRTDWCDEATDHALCCHGCDCAS